MSAATPPEEPARAAPPDDASSATAAPPGDDEPRPELVLRAGTHIAGRFEGHYVAKRPLALDDAHPSDLRAFDVHIVRGIVRDAVPTRAPPDIPDGDPRVFRQARLDPTWVELGTDTLGNRRIHVMVLTDLRIPGFRCDAVVDDGPLPTGTIVGDVVAEAHPVAKNPALWGWLVGCLGLLVPLLIVVWLVSGFQLGAAFAGVSSWLRDSFRIGVVGDGALDPDFGCGCGRVGGGGAGHGLVDDDGAGGRGLVDGDGAGRGRGIGDGDGAGRGPSGDDDGAGAGRGPSGDDDGAGRGRGPSGDDDGAGRGRGPGGDDDGAGTGGDGDGAGAGSADAAHGDGASADGAHFSVDEALADPQRFLARCGQSLDIDGELLFPHNQDTLRPQSQKELARVAALLRRVRSPALSLRVIGHADPTGDERHNLNLSLRRARRIARVLVRERVVARDRVTVEGRGEDELVVPADAPFVEQRRNRRVEIQVLCDEGGRP